MNKLTLCLALFLPWMCGCGAPVYTDWQNERSDATKEVDPAFDGYVHLFTLDYTRLAAKPLNPLRIPGIQFATLEEPTVGMCYGNGYVEIDPEWWFRAKSLRKRALFYHEMGHCLLNLDHGTGIMRPRLPSRRQLRKHWTRWVRELFQKERGSKNLRGVGHGS